MHRNLSILAWQLVMNLLFAQSVLAAIPAKWEKVSENEFASEVIRVISDGSLPQKLFSSPSSVYWKAGKQFSAIKIFSAPSRAIEITALFLGSTSHSNIFIGTSQGLYASKDQGKRWERVYFSSDPDEARVNAVCETRGKIFIGTHDGLRIREADSRNWQKFPHFSTNDPVHNIFALDESVLISTSAKVYLFNISTNRIEEIFSARFHKSIDEEAGADNSGITETAVLGRNERVIVIALNGQLKYKSVDDSEWNDLPVLRTSLVHAISGRFTDGCSEPKDNCLEIYAATEDGVYVHRAGHWQPAYKGMEALNVYDLSPDTFDGLYAATDKGLFYLDFREESGNAAVKHEGAQLLSHAPVSYRDYHLHFSEEPQIGQLHAWAIDYADVSNQKIRTWQRQARNRALWPSLSIGIDGDQDADISDTIYGSSSGSIVIGPDEKSNGRAYGWDVSLSWDLADFVWSTDQTSIDSRAKLMVELREDILDQITRVFFERRRLQIDRLSRQDMPAQEQVEADMRIDELSALLDSLTGGRFSGHINKGYSMQAGAQIKDESY